MQYFICKNPEFSEDKNIAINEFGKIYIENGTLYLPISKYETLLYDYYAKVWSKRNNETIIDKVEVDSVTLNDLCVADNYMFKIFTNDIVNHYRLRRSKICFPIINRGLMWYNHLSFAQKTELNNWYEAWLNVSETLIEPEYPKWLNSKLENFEEEVIL